MEAGVHFGHQTGRWNPKMKPYIFGQRNGIHIIDLQKTLGLFQEAVGFITKMASQGKTVLFVGTKSQAQESVEEEASRCGMYFINNRWLGGLLTNFSTVQHSIKRYRELESMRDNGFYDKLSKKEVARLERERKRLEKNLRGIKEMDRCPDALFVVDSNQEDIAIKEAAKLKIPIIAIVDTNSDPDLINYLIPGNDDALRAVKLFTGTIADAILAGRSDYEARVEAETRKAQEKAEKVASQRRAAKEAKEAVEAAQKVVQEKEEAAVVDVVEQAVVEASKEKDEVVEAAEAEIDQELALAPSISTPVAVDSTDVVVDGVKEEEQEKAAEKKTATKKVVEESETEKTKSSGKPRKAASKKKSTKNKVVAKKAKATKRQAKSTAKKKVASKKSVATTTSKKSKKSASKA